MIRIGLTGGIGSGKSLVCEVFLKLNIPVYSADMAARNLCDTDPDIREELILLFGKDIYQGKEMNRSLMASTIFHRSDMLQKVNQIIHPRVISDFETWFNNQTHAPYVIHESALLFESYIYEAFDRTITVVSPSDLRAKRVMARPGMTIERMNAIMNNQLPDEEKIARSNHILVNDESTPLLPQILSLHEIFTQIT
jgi:dephospho-CoA kinase